MTPRHHEGSPFEDPLVTLQRTFDQETSRLEQRHTELAQVRNALLQLASWGAGSTDAHAGPMWEPVTADLAPELVAHLLETVDGPLRSSIISLDAGPGLDDATIRPGLARISEGRVQRALYPIHALDTPQGRQWMQMWAEAGEQQRLSLEPPSDFAVFGQAAVMAVAEWGNAASNYVLIRDPMLVQAFAALFDRAYDRGLPVPAQHGQADNDPRLLRLLAVGLKDETIARYLGCSLRTVRRRVAKLMEAHAAETRFQLGAALARDGLVEAPRRRS